ncbi:MAG: lamin tail domain-containing protein, partial [Verrucomicrobiota bacterium]
QFQDKDLFPDKMPPVFSQHGGHVASGFELTMEPTARMYYTTDGSDPFTYSETGAIELSESASLYEEPISIDRTMTVKARFYNKSIFGGVTYSALNEATFSVGSENLQITEIMYHPTPPSDEEEAAGHTSSSLFEYLVVTNSGDQAADLSGIRFTNGIAFDFDTQAEKSLSPGASLILVRNQAAFEFRYGTGHPVVGEYEGKLDDGGERLTLTDAGGQELVSLRYNDKEPWPVEADGQGSSIKIAEALFDEDFSNSANWNASAPVGGGAQPVDGLDAWKTDNGITDLLADEDGDQLANIIEYVLATDPKKANANSESLTTSAEQIEVDGALGTYFTLTYVRRANSQGVTLALEASEDLVTWSDGGLVTQSKEAIDGNRETIVMRSANPVTPGSPKRYVRLKVTGP